MFQGYIDLDTRDGGGSKRDPGRAVRARAVLGELAFLSWWTLSLLNGLLGRRAVSGCADAVSMRREVAAMMSEAEIAAAQREARAWMTAH